jgi:hypothetical protein
VSDCSIEVDAGYLRGIAESFVCPLASKPLN